jgi:apolipoprotein N-acyltransferase
LRAWADVLRVTAEPRVISRPVLAGSGAVVDAMCLVAAPGLLLAVGSLEGSHWLAIPAGAALWRRLARTERWAPGALVAAGMLAPVPASAFAGLASFAPASWWLVVLGVAAGYGVVGSTAACLARGWPPAARPLAWGLGWATLDTVAVHGSPWALPPITPGYVLLDGPLVAWAAVGGPAALGLAWLAVGAALTASLGGFRVAERRVGAGARPLDARRRPGVLDARRRPGALAWGAAAVAVVLGSAGLQVAAARTPTGPETIVAVSEGVATEVALRASRDDPGVTGDLLRALVERARARPADLHIWPEVALGFAHADTLREVSLSAGALGAPILAGAYRRGPDDGWRNAVLLAEPQRAAWVIDKHRLVPGFEDWLEPGVGERWPVRAAGRRWGVLVCWESLFFDLAHERVRGGVDALVVLVHDGWAGASVTPRLHARAGRVLAWATGRPVVVASHDGPSMVWRHDGRALAQTDGGDDGLIVSVAAPIGWTPPYVRYGGRGVAAAVAVAWVGVVAATLAPRLVLAWRRRERQGCGAEGPQAA